MIIDIELDSIEQALNPYNKKQLAKDLDEYLMEYLKYNNLKNKKIILNIKGLKKKKEELTNIIHDYYNFKYKTYLKIDKMQNYIRLAFFMIGILAIIIARFTDFFFSEIVLIAGWVFIYEIVYDVLFLDVQRTKKAKLVAILSNCEIIFND